MTAITIDGRKWFANTNATNNPLKIQRQRESADDHDASTASR